MESTFRIRFSFPAHVISFRFAISTTTKLRLVARQSLILFPDVHHGYYFGHLSVDSGKQPKHKEGQDARTGTALACVTPNSRL